MQRRSVPRTDPRYNQVRARNNDSVKKSREKSRRERNETIESINQLEEENQQLIKHIEQMKQEYQQLQDLFQKHTGISLNDLMSSQTETTTTTTTTTMSPVQSKPVEEPPTEISSKPVLTINTNEESTSSETPLDPTSLDGAIVMINGVQYKIVSMNKT